jgi:hypothetical protein
VSADNLNREKGFAKIYVGEEKVTSYSYPENGEKIVSKIFTPAVTCKYTFVRGQKGSDLVSTIHSKCRN